MGAFSQLIIRNRPNTVNLSFIPENTDGQHYKLILTNIKHLQLKCKLLCISFIRPPAHLRSQGVQGEYKKSPSPAIFVVFAASCKTIASPFLGVPSVMQNWLQANFPGFIN